MGKGLDTQSTFMLACLAWLKRWPAGPSRNFLGFINGKEAPLKWAESVLQKSAGL